MQNNDGQRKQNILIQIFLIQPFRNFLLNFPTKKFLQLLQLFS